MMHELSAASGVDLEAGNVTSASAAEIQVATHQNSPFLVVHDRSGGHFRGLRTFTYRDLPPNVEFSLGADGNGTKTVFNVLAGKPRSAGFDLSAMTVGDATRKGGMPLALINQLDVSTLKTEEARTFARGLMQGLNDALASVYTVGLGGETAEMNEFVGSEITGAPINFNWCAAVHSAFDPDRMITGASVKANQVVIALQEQDGYRCNGGSTVRLAFRLKFGSRWKVFRRKWWEHPEAQQWLPRAAAPATLYDALLVDANGWLDIERIPVTGIAHLTGGGIPEKLGNLLAPLGLSAHLPHLYPPTSIMQACADWLREAGKSVTDAELYATFNGGQGALVILEDQYVDKFLFRASTLGVRAQVAGHIMITNTPCIRISSKYRGGSTFEVPIA